jgi:hypothetical protein
VQTLEMGQHVAEFPKRLNGKHKTWRQFVSSTSRDREPRQPSARGALTILLFQGRRVAACRNTNCSRARQLDARRLALTEPAEETTS